MKKLFLILLALALGISIGYGRHVIAQQFNFLFPDENDLLQPVDDDFGIYTKSDFRFDAEIKPDGELCSNADVLQKTGSDDWDCIAPEVLSPLLYDAVLDPDGSEDFTDITAALDAGHRTLYLKKGSYLPTADISLNQTGDKIVIAGESREETIIDFANGNFNITGSGATDFVIKDLTIRDSSDSQGAIRTGINGQFIVDNIHFISNSRDMHIEGTEGIIKNSTFEADNGIRLNGASAIRIYGNVFNENGSINGVSTPTKNTIVGNIFKGTNSFTYAGNDSTWIGNTFGDSNNSQFVSFSLNGDNNTFANNKILSPGNIAGLIIGSSANFNTVSGNVIVGRTGGQEGISIAGDNNVVYGNVLKDNTGAGIELETTADSNLVYGNYYENNTLENLNNLGTNNTVFFFDSTNSRFGFNTTSPAYLFQVGNILTNEYFSVNASGTATTSRGMIIGTTVPPINPIPVGDLFVGNKATTSVALWVGSGGTANNLDLTGGDLYVQNQFEVDGVSYFKNMEIDGEAKIADDTFTFYEDTTFTTVFFKIGAIDGNLNAIAGRIGYFIGNKEIWLDINGVTDNTPHIFRFPDFDGVFAIQNNTATFTSVTTTELVIGNTVPSNELKTGDLFIGGNATTSGVLAVGTSNCGSLDYTVGDLCVGDDLQVLGDTTVVDIILVNVQNNGNATTTGYLSVGTGNAASFNYTAGDLNVDNNLLVFGSATTTGSLAVDSTTLIVQADTNRVGIGTAAPAHELHVLASSDVALQLESTTSVVDVVMKNDNATWRLRVQAAGEFNVRDDVAGTNPFTVEEGAGSDTLVVDSNSRVGIGTASPTYELDVVGNLGIDEFLHHNDDTDTHLRFLANRAIFIVGNRNMLDLDSTGTINEVVINQDGNSDVDFRVQGDTEDNLLFTDASTDRVGVGTSTPQTELSVTGSGSFTGQVFDVGVGRDPASNDINIRFGFQGGTVEQFFWDNSESEFRITDDLRIDGDLNVTSKIGIATSTPKEAFVIAGGRMIIDGKDTGVLSSGSGNFSTDPALTVANTANVNLPTIYVEGFAADGGSAGAIIQLNRNSSGSWQGLLIYSQGTNATIEWRVGTDRDATSNYYIMDGGSNKFFTVIDDGSTGSFGINSTTPFGVFAVENTGSNLSFVVNDVASDATPFVVDASGNVGIGTSTPQQLLHVSAQTSGDAQFILEADTDNSNEDDNPTILLKQDGNGINALLGMMGNASLYTGAISNALYIEAKANSDIQFVTGGAVGGTDGIARMIILRGGNVGINVTAPATKLEIDGTASTTDLVVGNSTTLGNTTSDQLIISDNEPVITNLQNLNGTHTVCWDETSKELSRQSICTKSPIITNKNTIFYEISREREREREFEEKFMINAGSIEAKHKYVLSDYSIESKFYFELINNTPGETQFYDDIYLDMRCHNDNQMRIAMSYPPVESVFYYKDLEKDTALKDISKSDNIYLELPENESFDITFQQPEAKHAIDCKWVDFVINFEAYYQKLTN